MSVTDRSRHEHRPSVVGFLTQHPIHRGPTDLKRLDYVDRPHALRLHLAHADGLYRRWPAFVVARRLRLGDVFQLPFAAWVGLNSANTPSMSRNQRMLEQLFVA
jgi:hypothetical protein